MANVIKNDLQIKACEEINKMLAEVNRINYAITEKLSFTVSFGHKQSVSLDDAFRGKVISILKAQRVKKIKDIRSKAAKFNISLDADDLDVISDEAIVSAAHERNIPEVPPDVDDVDLEEDM